MPLRRRIGLLALTSTLALGCRSTPRCDQARLAALAETLDDATPDARAGLVAGGLPAACELAAIVPPLIDPAPAPASVPVLAREPDPHFRADVERACPDFGRVSEQAAAVDYQERAALIYRECRFGRFELIARERFEAASRAALVTYSTHALMLAENTPAPVAKSISRALFELELITLIGPALVEAREGLELAQVPAATELREGPVLYVSPHDVALDSRPLLTLDDGRPQPDELRGHIIRPLYGALSDRLDHARARAERREKDASGLLLLALDERVPTATLIDLLYTAGQAEYSSFGLVVEPAYPLRRMIELSPPRFGERLQAPPLRAHLSSEGIRVRTDPTGSEDGLLLPRRDDGWDYATLAQQARAHRAAFPAARTAIVSATDETPAGAVLRALATLAGPECVQHGARLDDDDTTCILPRLMIEARLD